MSIDRVVRGLWTRAIAATLPAAAPGAAERARRILFLRHDAIGDMLSSLALLRTMTRHGLEVDVLASPANAAVLTGNPWGLRVMTTAREAGEHRYDAVVDGLVLKPAVNSRTVRLIRASRAPVRVGTGGRENDFIYTHPVAADLTANHVEVLAELLTPFGIPPGEALDQVAMPLSEDERALAKRWWCDGGAGMRLFVNLSASSEERRWPDARFSEVLAALAREHPTLRIAVSGSPADWSSAAVVAAAAGGRAFTGSLRDAFAVLASSDVVLTPDTSVAHAAAGFGVRSVVLTPQDNLRFAPWRAPARLVIAPGRRVDTIGADVVTAELRAVLGEQQGRRR